MHPQRRTHTSWMNDTRWCVVLGVLAEEKVACRVKLVCNDYLAAEAPGDDVIVAFGDRGDASLLRDDIIWLATPGYWDSASIGPFQARDIDWLDMSTETFNALRSRFPPNLRVIERLGRTVILGYEAC